MEPQGNADWQMNAWSVGSAGSATPDSTAIPKSQRCLRPWIQDIIESLAPVAYDKRYSSGLRSGLIDWLIV
jgi:hypothetical protein